MRARRHVLWIATAATAAAVPLLLMASAAATPTYPVTRVSTDTFTDPIALHASEQSGNTVAAGKTIVSTSGVGAIFDGGNSGIGWSTSTDGGKSWKHGYVPVTSEAPPAGVSGGVSPGPTSPGPVFPLTRADHPVVAHNARYGQWLISSIGMNGNAVTQALLVNRSTDGKTWGQPIIAHQASAPGDAPASEWITCDNWPTSAGYGNCYLVYDNAGAGTQLQMQMSTDGGLTWSAPVATSGDTSSTTLSAASAVGATNIKVASVANITAGQTLVVDSGGASPETVTVTAVGTSGSGGTGVTFTPALAFAHASGATVTENNVSATGTGPVPLVQPPVSSGTCGRVVVPYTLTTSSLGQIVSADCGAAYGAHTVITTLAAQHTVLSGGGNGLKTSLLPSDAIDAKGAIYLAYQTRSFRTAQTTLSAAANAGDTNIKVGSVTGMVAGGTLMVDATGSSPETVTITAVGTQGAGGTGVTFTPALAFAHASGAIVTVNGVLSTSTAAPNDIAMAVMPAPTGATPAPVFGAPIRIPIESDAGASTNTNDHFIPAIALDHTTSGAGAHVGLFYYTVPLAACLYDDPFAADHCSLGVGYVSSRNGGSTWSDPTMLVTGMSPAWLPRLSGGPSFGNYLGADVVSSGPLSGNAFVAFAAAKGGNSTHQELDVPSHGLVITSP